MKASFIKYEKDYQLPKLLGMNIEEIKEPEEIDNKIEELKKQKYTTIVIPNERPVPQSLFLFSKYC